jgi:ABC-type glycerol-3-phosphate transport system substrate-binding protein
MMRFRKMGVAMILAAALAAGAATTAVSASADAALPVAMEANVDDPCQALSEIIAFLEQRPPSRLRDFLLAQARRLFATYCAA